MIIFIRSMSGTGTPPIAKLMTNIINDLSQENFQIMLTILQHTKQINGYKLLDVNNLLLSIITQTIDMDASGMFL